MNPVKQHQTFSIALEEDHSLGETWQLVKDENSQAFENLGSNWRGSKKGVRFHLKPLQTGTYRLSFKKTRMGDSVETRYFLVEVKSR